MGVVENMSGFTTPDGQRFTIFGEGGGQQLADDIDAPLLGKVPLQEELRVARRRGTPLVAEDPDAPASQALFHLARGLVAATPRELPVIQAPALAAGARLRRQGAAGHPVGAFARARRARRRAAVLDRAAVQHARRPA